MLARLQGLQRYLDRPWYPLLLAGLAAADLIVIVIPVDGLTVAAILAVPRRWIQFAVAATVGNLIGCGILAEGVYRNASWIHERFGSWMEHSAWQTVEGFIQTHGSWAVLVGSLSPIPLQFWVIVPALAKMSAVSLFVALLFGRLFRSVALCWAASHAPRLLLKSKSIREELQEATEQAPKS